MRGSLRLLGLLAVLALPLACVRAEDKEKPKEGEKPRGSGFQDPRTTLANIEKKLGADLALTEEQKPKVQAALEALSKKVNEAEANEAVKAAKAERDKAYESGNKDVIVAAARKYRDAVGFSSYEELKKALAAIPLSEAQLKKIFPANPNLPRNAGKPEKKPDAGPGAAPLTP